MKKLMIALIGLMLMTGVCLAETKVISTTELDSSVSLTGATNCYYYFSQGTYHLFTAEGQLLTEGYKDMVPRCNGLYFEMALSQQMVDF